MEKQFDNINILLLEMARCRELNKNFQLLDVSEQLKFGFLCSSGDQFIIDAENVTKPKYCNKQDIKQMNVKLVNIMNEMVQPIMEK